MNRSSEVSRVVRVLVVDDSAFMRSALSRMIESDLSLHVVGTAQNGLETLEKISSLQPDVITLDVEMPGLNGLQTLKRIMRDFPRPVIMVSSLTQEGAQTTLDALDYGAFDYLPKQLSYGPPDVDTIRVDLIAKIHAAAEYRHSRLVRNSIAPAPELFAWTSTYRPAPTIIAIGTSTGGPRALQQLLPMLPADFPAPILVVQHMPVGFTGPFAHRLNNLCKLAVQEASQNEVAQPGVVYIAPAGQHLTVSRAGPRVVLRLSALPADTPHIPSVDVLMLSLADQFRSLAMGVIMTGMGSDGAHGMQAIYEAGGFTLGQDEASCTVWGMPRVCAEKGILRCVVPLVAMPRQFLQAIGYPTQPSLASP